MDPLTALGLASNVIQLISFTSDLVSKSRKIYKSADRGLVENLELETIARSLRDLRNDLSLPSADENTPLSKTDHQILEICESCAEVSRELFDVIQGLKVQGDHKRWSSFREALNSVWKEEAIEKLAKRLERYRSQLDTTLLMSIREHVQNDKQEAANLQTKACQNGFASLEKESKTWHEEFLEAALQNNWQIRSQQDMASFSMRLSAHTKNEREDLMKAQILEQLCFTNMGDRYERIEDAYKKTFDWIFKDGGDVANDRSSKETTVLTEENWVLVSRMATRSFVHGEESSRAAGDGNSAPGDAQAEPNTPRWSSFTDWLNGEEDLYWITGKPGSGKSTLMKYIFNDPRTMERIRDWTGDVPLITAGFFFWNSGTVMQMSKMGLLQALLYESINSSFELVPILFPDRWRSYELFGGDLRPWSWSELALAMKKLLSNESHKFFFLIDGLDEFDGTSSELVHFILEHSARPNVKICVASRPWLVFEDAFQKRPSLRLEDLTAPDIRMFTSESLRQNLMFKSLEALQPQESERLIVEVTSKASGVFLWVRLVILSLLEGLRDGDRIVDLQKRLHHLPSDLEALFHKILNRLNPSYFEQASRLFQLVREWEKPMSLLVLSFAEEGFNNAIATETNAMSLAQAEYRAETMRRRLNSRCKGLLEAPVSKQRPILTTQVQFLHRTVRDFLSRPDIWEYIVSGGPQAFDPQPSWCGASLLELKSTSMAQLVTSDFHDLLTAGINYSLKLETRNPQLHIQYLREVDRVCSKLFGSPFPGGGTWLAVRAKMELSLEGCSIYHWAAILSKETNPPLNSFFEYAVYYPFYSFVDHELKGGLEADSFIGGRSLLHIAVSSRHLKMIGILLDHGADPNLCSGHIPGRTPWIEFLIQLKLLEWRPLDTAAEIFSTFLGHNANPRLAIDNESIEDIIKTAFWSWNAERADDLLRKTAVLKNTFKAPKKPLGMKTVFRRLGKRDSTAK